MIRHRFTLLSVVLVFAFTLSAGALSAQKAPISAPSAVEGFDIPVLEDGQAVHDSFNDQVGTQLYTFQGSADDVVTITMTQITDTLDPFLVLLGPNGEMVASDDDSGTGANLAAAIDAVTLPSDGTYLVIASSFVNIDAILDEITGTQEFTLTLSGNTAPAESNGDAAGTLAIDAKTLELGATLNGESTLENPVGYYTFTADEGDTLDFTIEEADFDTVLHLFDAQGHRVAINDDDDVRGGLISAIRDFTVPAPGSYLLVATDVFFYSAGDSESVLQYSGGTYSVSVNTAK